jgi:hypothetical protein
MPIQAKEFWSTALDEPAGAFFEALGNEELGSMNGALNWVANFIWGIADDVLRDLYVRGKYRDVILPMTVITST